MTPWVNLPSPSQSPTTGLDPSAPYRKEPASGRPALVSLRRFQSPRLGAKTPMVQMPSPFQSPATGTALLPPRSAVVGPNTKVRSAGPALLLLRRWKVAVEGVKVPTVK